MPEPAVIERALTIYQEVLRRPSLTAMCLDFSGSMKGTGETDLKQAIDFLFTPARASEALVQWTPQDRIILIPFSSVPAEPIEGTGKPEDQSRLDAEISKLSAGG